MILKKTNLLGVTRFFLEEQLMAEVLGAPATSINGFNNVPVNNTGLPGTTTASNFAGGVIFYALLLTLVGLVLSAGLWAVGSFSNNYTQSVNGKKGFLICAVSALAIGAAYLLISWFYGQGSTLQ
jgi:hypothetical protein